MPESLATLIKAVQQLNESNEGLATEVADLAAKVAENDRHFVRKSDAEKKATKFKKAMIGIVIGGLAVASCVGITLDLNHSTTCGVRAILTSAKSASARNPLPETLTPEERTNVETQREQAQQFYTDSLNHLHILWPCAGEKV